MIHSQNTSKMTKHVGTYNDKRIAVVLQLPEEPGMVHIVDTDALPDLYSQNLIDIINKPQSQQSRWLGDILHREMFFDGTNALRTLYEKRFIQVVPVDSVTLTPFPNRTVPLSDVLVYFRDPVDEKYAEIAAQEQDKLNEAIAKTMADVNVNVPDPIHNQHLENLGADRVEQGKMIAANLIAEAQMLEAEAVAKRRQAAQFDPSKLISNSGGETAFVDPVTGKSYKTESALKGAVTRRNKSAQG
ncbi:hypothetical protein LCGC14_1716740 [marine sediment metagenome]|uniref:Uncharacterized protein n=1 Tax=marine sediment metagenome TaxID=412755 RepID=A0A0F9HDV5_9ZZZZ